jgi:hypothetical protein
MVDLE